GGGPRPGPRLDAVGHGARGLPPQADDGGAVGRGVCVVLPAPVLAHLDLASSADEHAGGVAVLGDVVLVQALEPAVAPADSAALDGAGVARVSGADAAAAFEVSPAVGGG